VICDFCYMDKLVTAELPITLNVDISPFVLASHTIEPSEEQERICTMCMEVEIQFREGQH